MPPTKTVPTAAGVKSSVTRPSREVRAATVETEKPSLEPDGLTLWGGFDVGDTAGTLQRVVTAELLSEASLQQVLRSGRWLARTLRDRDERVRTRSQTAAGSNERSRIGRSARFGCRSPNSQFPRAGDRWREWPKNLLSELRRRLLVAAKLLRSSVSSRFAATFRTRPEENGSRVVAL